LTITSTTSESGVVMGVRHKEFTIEAVQYHPESVMSEGGRELMGNFLKLEGGKWGGKNAWCGVEAVHEDKVETLPVTEGLVQAEVQGATSSNGSKAKSDPAAVPTILNRIHQQRLQDVESASARPSTSTSILKTSIALHAAPPVVPLVARISQTLPAHPAVMAEIKRASPSKGDIAIDANAPSQAIKYALAGASVISVLTEPTWFKGALSDLLSVRQALDSLPNRPALLRKDFIIDKYQVDEARMHGADTILLIVAMLSVTELRDLYDYSVSLGMEPLVEVNNAEELNIALDLGAKVVGVNNRNLHDFKVDMQTTSRLADVLRERGREDVILCALSGITGRSDVERYISEGVKAVLIGESLMRAGDPKKFIHDLLAVPTPKPIEPVAPLVKICGVQTFEDAKVAADAGADFIGIIFAPTRRKIALPVAKKISAYLRSIRHPEDEEDLDAQAAVDDPLAPLPWFTSRAQMLSKSRKPLLVGVFQNQSLSYILSAVQSTPLDIVQLHGDEPQEWARQIPVPVIKAFRVTDQNVIRGGQVDRPGCNDLILLDAAGKSGSAGGGEGVKFDWSVAAETVTKGEVGTGGAFRLPIVLAGGLTPESVAEAVQAVKPWCVDVSSGTERSDGQGKDAQKIADFIKRAKQGTA
jgi:anthranilate synthase/indole-3-glycerol phosphate synthase/phosphoribosylanthranilate isomerase